MTSLHLQPPPFGGDTGMEDTMELASDAGRVGEDIDIDLDYPQEEGEHPQHDDDYMLDDVRSNNGEQPPSVDMGMEDEPSMVPQEDIAIAEPQTLEDVQPDTGNIDLPLDYVDVEAPQITEAEVGDLIEDVPAPEEGHIEESFNGPDTTQEQLENEVAQAEEVQNVEVDRESAVSDAAQSTNAFGSDPKDSDVSWDHSVFVLFEGNEMSLFPPLQDSDDSLTYLLQEKTLAHSKISVLLSEIRSVLSSAFSEGDEITMSIDVLDLHILEGSSFCTGYSLSDIVEIYQNLLERDEHVDHNEPLWVHLHRKTSAEGRISALRDAISREESLSSLGLWEAYNGPHNEHEKSEESEYDDGQPGEHTEEAVVEAEAEPDVQAVSNEASELASGEAPSDENTEAQDSSATLQGDSLPAESKSIQQANAESSEFNLSQHLSNPDDEEPIDYADEAEDEEPHNETKANEEESEEYKKEAGASNDGDEVGNEYPAEDEPSEEAGENLDDPLGEDGEQNYDDNYDDGAIHFSLDAEASQLQSGTVTGDSVFPQEEFPTGTDDLDEPEHEPESELVGDDFVDLAGADDGAEDDFDGQDNFNSVSELDEHRILDDETWIKPPGQDFQDDFNNLGSGLVEPLPVATDSAAASSPVTITNDNQDATQNIDDGNDFLNLDYEADDADQTLTGETQSPSSGLKRQHEELDDDDNGSVHSESKRARAS